MAQQFGAREVNWIFIETFEAAFYTCRFFFSRLASHLDSIFQSVFILLGQIFPNGVIKGRICATLYHQEEVSSPGGDVVIGRRDQGRRIGVGGEDREQSLVGISPSGEHLLKRGRV